MKMKTFLKIMWYTLISGCLVYSLCSGIIYLDGLQPDNDHLERLRLYKGEISTMLNYGGYSTVGELRKELDCWLCEEPPDKENGLHHYYGYAVPPFDKCVQIRNRDIPEQMKGKRCIAFFPSEPYNKSRRR